MPGYNELINHFSVIIQGFWVIHVFTHNNKIYCDYLDVGGQRGHLPNLWSSSIGQTPGIYKYDKITSNELTLVCWDWNTPRERDQYLNCLCPSSFCHQVVSTHGIEYRRYTVPCLPWGRVSNTLCVISVPQNDSKWKYNFSSKQFTTWMVNSLWSSLWISLINWLWPTDGIW